VYVYCPSMLFLQITIIYNFGQRRVCRVCSLSIVLSFWTGVWRINPTNWSYVHIYYVKLTWFAYLFNNFTFVEHLIRIIICSINWTQWPLKHFINCRGQFIRNGFLSKTIFQAYHINGRRTGKIIKTQCVLLFYFFCLLNYNPTSTSK